MRSAKIPSGRTYRYAFTKPCSAEKPYLLFLHGFPSSSFDWRHQIDYFAHHGYGIIAPDLLGYGGTDNPSDLASFSLKNMAYDIEELLECEGVKAVFGIAHDL
jgi:pimeloyl-ACP methyl ester carboxylesterase